MGRGNDRGGVIPDWMYVNEDAARDALAELVEERWRGWVATYARPYDIVDAFLRILNAGHWKIAPMATDDDDDDTFDVLPLPAGPTKAVVEWNGLGATAVVSINDEDVEVLGDTLACALNECDRRWPSVRFEWQVHMDGSMVAKITPKVPQSV